MKKFLIILTAAAAVVTTAGLVLLWAVDHYADRIIFQPTGDGREPGRNVVQLSVAPGKSIAVRHVKTRRSGAFTVLHSHGNTENLDQIKWRQEAFSRHGYNSVAYDYEGYGASDGTPSEAGACRDIERVWRYLTVECGVPPEKIVLHGYSVGGGPTSFLAAKVRPAAVVLEAPFTSTFAVAHLSWLPGDRFRNLELVPRFTAPLLIVHGDRDRIIPQSHGRRLYEAAAVPKRFLNVRGAGHGNIVDQAGTEYWLAFDAIVKTGEVERKKGN